MTPETSTSVDSEHPSKAKLRRAQNPHPYIAIDLDESRAGASLIEAFEKSHASQRVFAHLMGCSPFQLNRYLTGKKRVTRAALRQALFAAMASGVSCHFPRVR
jgi:hypothetical protein